MAKTYKLVLEKYGRDSEEYIGKEGDLWFDGSTYDNGVILRISDGETPGGGYNVNLGELEYRLSQLEQSPSSSGWQDSIFIPEEMLVNNEHSDRIHVVFENSTSTILVDSNMFSAASGGYNIPILIPATSTLNVTSEVLIHCVDSGFSSNTISVTGPNVVHLYKAYNDVWFMTGHNITNMTLI